MAVGNMLRVLRGNQEVLISPANKAEYLKKGYSVIDEDGNVLEQGVKSERMVKNELDAANKRIGELEAEIARLKSRGRRGKKDGDQEDDSAQENEGSEAPLTE